MNSYIDAVRKKVDDLAVEVERLENKVLELEETESELRDDLRETTRELNIADEQLPKRIAALLKAYVAHTPALTRAEHLDVISQLSPSLASVVRALVE